MLAVPNIALNSLVNEALPDANSFINQDANTFINSIDLQSVALVLAGVAIGAVAISLLQSGKRQEAEVKQLPSKPFFSERAVEVLHGLALFNLAFSPFFIPPPRPRVIFSRPVFLNPFFDVYRPFMFRPRIHLNIPLL